MKKYIVLMLSFLLLGCGSDSVYDAYDRSGLLDRINHSYDSKNYAASRDGAESFIARFPQDEQIDVVRIKLLASYVYSAHYKMANAYADRLLQGVLLNEVYYEDVEYYKIMIKIEKSKHMYAQKIWRNDIYRNFSELSIAAEEIQQFLTKHPNSAYTQALEEYNHDLRFVLAEHQLKIALHYAYKGNIKAMEQRLKIYYNKYSDVKTPLLDEVLSYQDT